MTGEMTTEGTGTMIGTATVAETGTMIVAVTTTKMTDTGMTGETGRGHMVWTVIWGHQHIRWALVLSASCKKDAVDASQSQ